MASKEVVLPEHPLPGMKPHPGYEGILMRRVMDMGSSDDGIYGLKPEVLEGRSQTPLVSKDRRKNAAAAAGLLAGIALRDLQENDSEHGKAREIVDFFAGILLDRAIKDPMEDGAGQKKHTEPGADGQKGHFTVGESYLTIRQLAAYSLADIAKGTFGRSDTAAVRQVIVDSLKGASQDRRNRSVRSAGIDGLDWLKEAP